MFHINFSIRQLSWSKITFLYEESLPASLYQWATGNTKKKQAQEALDYIRNNPQQQGSKIYKEAERKLNRFGYLLDDGPMDIDLKEIGNMIKQSPGLFGAEMVNMVMADPYLLFMPLGWGKLGRGVVNSLRLKYSKRFQVTKSTYSENKMYAMCKMMLSWCRHDKFRIREFNYDFAWNIWKCCELK